ncbi:MAG: hypothetical protein ACM3JJ_09580 [Hyphomicrobiales bacterium]
MTLVAQICLAAAVALFVLSPLLLYRGQRSEQEAPDADLRRSILERKTRLYSQLLELDFDRDAGKMSADDHVRMRDETMNEVLAVLAEEERLGVAPGARRERPRVIPGGDRVERMIEEFKRTRKPGATAERS